MRPALLIINSQSRNGKGVTTKAVRGLQQIGIDPVVGNCSDPSDLSPLIKERARGVRLVVIGGGDGTLNAAAAGLIAAKLPLAILPTGTANDLARTLNIPEDLESAIGLITDSRLRRIDVGSVNGKLFFNVASLGLSAELATKLTSEVKSRFGKVGYAVAAARVLAQARPFRAEIKSPDGSRRGLTLQIAVGNGRFYGGGNVIQKDAAIDDGCLDLYSLEFLRAWKLVLMFRAFRRGEHDTWHDVRALQGTDFEIRTRRPKLINADGEIITHTPARFHVLPGAIEVFVPNGAD